MVIGNRRAELALRDVLERSGAPERASAAGRPVLMEVLRDPALWAGLAPLGILVLLLVLCVAA